MSPHSLGKLIEWKLFAASRIWRDSSSPHSLGKLIEWKPMLVVDRLDPLQFSPHSLGKLIEWKQGGLPI